MSSDQPGPYPPQQGQPGYPPQTGQPGYPAPQAPPMQSAPTQGAPAAYPIYPSAPPAQQWVQTGPPLASWGDRVLATLIDMLYQLPAMVLYMVGIFVAVINAPTTSTRGVVVNRGNPGLMWLGLGLLAIGALGMMAISLYNVLALQGKTGQTWGKKRIGIKVIHQVVSVVGAGVILSVGQTFLRQLCHYLDSAVYIGYLWPLWDPMRQTFADKLMKTVVIKIK